MGIEVEIFQHLRISFTLLGIVSDHSNVQLSHLWCRQREQLSLRLSVLTDRLQITWRTRQEEEDHTRPDELVSTNDRQWQLAPYIPQCCHPPAGHRSRDLFSGSVRWPRQTVMWHLLHASIDALSHIKCYLVRWYRIFTWCS